MPITISGGVQLSGPVLLDPTGGSSPTPGGGGASNFGYVSGGLSPGSISRNTIQKFSFSSDGNSTDVGDLTQSRYGVAGSSSSTSGYTSGGWAPGASNIIDKFPFASDGNASDVGDMTNSSSAIGCGNSSAENGYVAGGLNSNTALNVIDKFPFSADSNASDVGDLAFGVFHSNGQSSSTNGYTSSGQRDASGSWAMINFIQKFPFASDGNASDVADLANSVAEGGGQSSSDNGYVTGGIAENIIQKFPFSSDNNATDIGDITVARVNTGQSSNTSGYSSGGQGTESTIIDKFPFSSDDNATDVGDLVIGGYDHAGQQY